MQIVQHIQEAVVSSLTQLYNSPYNASDFQVNQTKPEFTGDYTVVLFSLLKKTGRSPQALGDELGAELVRSNPGLFLDFNVIKGFLNLSVHENYWLDLLIKEYSNEAYGKHPRLNKKVMVEYSSPNTNKPLHLGHLRNNFLGWSVAEILDANGYDVLKSCIVNDRGIHICKSMKAWIDDADKQTPESSGIKGDHLVGDYYVKAENTIKAEAAPIVDQIRQGDLGILQESDRAEIEKLNTAFAKLTDSKEDIEKKKKINDDIVEIARKNTAFMKATQQMLKDWEAGEPSVIELWNRMNGWVYEGFDSTYRNIGSDFDEMYYESNTYLLGKDIVQDGLNKGVFYKKDDGSVWIDLTADGMDEKLVLRKDGTSVYITQDIGLAQQKYEEYKIDQSIYVIGDEQNYHMKVLKLIAQKLGVPYADHIYHLSYGMVELPTGKMKSREGTVVDADDMVSEMELVAKQKTEELGKVKDFTEAELKELYHVIGLGALKFFLLRVDPKKRMIFNPEESIDFHGFTGPFIQFNHARIRSVLRKNEIDPAIHFSSPLLTLEKELLVSLEKYPAVIAQAAAELNPSAIAIYVYQLAKSFSSFYTEHSIAGAETEEKKQLRLRLASMTANTISSGMRLLGIAVPERM